MTHVAGVGKKAMEQGTSLAEITWARQKDEQVQENLKPR